MPEMRLNLLLRQKDQSIHFDYSSSFQQWKIEKTFFPSFTKFYQLLFVPPLAYLFGSFSYSSCIEDLVKNANEGRLTVHAAAVCCTVAEASRSACGIY